MYKERTGSEKGMYKCKKKEGQDEGENGKKVLRGHWFRLNI